MVSRPNIENAKNEALKILKGFGYTKPPVNIVEICKEMGLQIYETSFNEQANISGYYDHQNKVIVVNDKDILSRKMFTIAHELGHYVLHKSYLEKVGQDILYRDSFITPQKDPKEIEANKFAANIMAPKFMLDYYYKNFLNGIFDIGEIAEVFVLSRQMMTYRFKEEYDYSI